MEQKFLFNKLNNLLSLRNEKTSFNSQCVFHFFGVTREKELFPNGRFSGCNLIWQSSNPKRDQLIRNTMELSVLSFCHLCYEVSFLSFSLSSCKSLSVSRLLCLDVSLLFTHFAFASIIAECQHAKKKSLSIKPELIGKVINQQFN